MTQLNQLCSHDNALRFRKTFHVESYSGTDIQRISSALADLQAAGRGTLVFEAGLTYDIGTRTDTDNAFFTLTGCANFVIEGEGAMLSGAVLGNRGSKTPALLLYNCARFTVQNLRFTDTNYAWDFVPTSAAPVRGMEGVTIAVNGTNGLLYKRARILNCSFENMATCVQVLRADGTTSRHEDIFVLDCDATNCAYGYGGFFNGNDVEIRMRNRDVRRSIILYGGERINFDVTCYNPTSGLALGNVSITPATNPTLGVGHIRDITGRIRFSGYSNGACIAQIEPQTDLTTDVDCHDVNLYIDATGTIAQPQAVVRITCYNEAGTEQLRGSPNVDFDNITLDGTISRLTGGQMPLYIKAWTDKATWDEPGRLELRGMFAGESVNNTRWGIPGFMGFVDGHTMVMTTENAVQLSTNPVDIPINRYTDSYFAFQVDVYAANDDDVGTAAHTYDSFIVLGHKPSSGAAVLDSVEPIGHAHVTTDAGTTITMTSAPDHHFRVTFPSYTGANGFASVKCRPLSALA